MASKDKAADTPSTQNGDDHAGEETVVKVALSIQQQEEIAAAAVRSALANAEEAETRAEKARQALVDAAVQRRLNNFWGNFGWGLLAVFGTVVTAGAVVGVRNSWRDGTNQPNIALMSLSKGE